MNIKYILCLCLILVYSQCLFASQQPFSTPVFKQYNVSDGLADSNARAILQDRSGFIWFGTSSGLSRFDGYTFTNFKSNAGEKGLSHTWITKLVEDSEGYLWVGTISGLNRFDPHTEQFTHYLHNKDDLSSISHNSVFALFIDDKGVLWLGTGNGLNKYNPLTESFTPYHSPFSKSSNIITTIAQGPNNDLWLGTSGGGLLRFDRDDEIFYEITLSTYTSHPKTKYIEALKFEDNNRLWLGTQTGLVEYEVKSKQSTLHLLYGHRQANVLTIYQDASKKLLLGYLNEGLCQYQLDSQQWSCFKNSSQLFPAHSIYTIYKSRDEILWLGTIRNGVIYFKPNYPFKLIRFHKPDIKVFSIDMDESQNLWAGTSAGTFKVNKNRQITFYQHNDDATQKLDSGKSTYGIFFAKNKQIWVGTDNGLSLYNALNDQFETINIINEQTSEPISRIMTINENSASDLLISVYSQGLLKWRPGKIEATPVPVSTNAHKGITKNILSTFSDSNQRLWVFGYQFLGYYEDASERIIITQFTPDQAYFFLHMAQSPNGKRWLLNYESIHELDENGNLVKEFNKKIFNDSRLVGLVATNDYLWVSTNFGLWRLDPTTQDLKHYTKADGLQSNDFSWANYIDTDQTVYLGGSNGITVFHPDDFDNINSTPARVRLTKFQLNNKTVSVGSPIDGFSLQQPINLVQQITLNHKQSRFFSLEFSALDYFAPENSQYAYKLSGLNDDWVYTDASDRKAVYTFLPAGNYTFQVKAANHFDIWSELAQSLNIEILPPWWLTLWAKMVYAGLFLLATFLYVQRRTYRLRRQAKILRLEVDKRTAEIQQQTDQIQQQKDMIEQLLEKKNVLFANTSHELRTPLTLILGLSKRLLKEQAYPLIANELENIKLNAQRLSYMIEQLLNFSRLSFIAKQKQKVCLVSEVAHHLMLSLKSLMQERQLKFEVDIIHDAALALAPEDALETMLINLLSNAAKYTPIGGTVKLQVYNGSDDNIDIVVSDSGPGINPDQQAYIFERFSRLPEHIQQNIPGTGLGLALVRELAEANNGSVNVEDSPLGGALFRIRLPQLEQLPKPTSYSSEPREITLQLPKETALDDTEIIQSSDIQHQYPSVLLIDDTKDLCIYIKSELEAEYNIFIAHDGHKGLQLAKQYTPDLIICDVMMPGIDGFEVLKRLRDDIEICHIPLILLTAKGGQESEIQAYTEKADDYITKPFDADMLRARIKNLIELRAIITNKTAAQSLKGEIDEQTPIHELSAKDNEFIKRFNLMIRSNYQNTDFDIENMCAILGISKSPLSRKIKALLHYSPYQYLRIYRLEKAAEQLREGYSQSMEHLSHEVGFVTQQHFSSCFKEHFGVTPSKYVDTLKA